MDSYHPIQLANGLVYALAGVSTDPDAVTLMLDPDCLWQPGKLNPPPTNNGHCVYRWLDSIGL